jgi:beta-phosphoglucomutase-like phosphatase (HAD superfamily)
MSDNIETQQQAAAPAPEWPFAPSYRERFGALPGSQQREAVKRLCMRARNPLTSDKLTEESPDVEACLSALYTAYTSKKERARIASASKRASEKEAKKAAAAGIPEPGPPATAAAVVEAEPAPADLAKSISDLALEPASVVCEPAPGPGPAKVVPVVLPPVSQPIPIPALAQSSKPVQKAVPVARGLSAMLKR